MKNVIGVRFREGGKTYFFSPGELEIKEGDGVIVETARGTEFGDVVGAPQEVEDNKVVLPLKDVLRVASAHDREQRDKNRAKEKEAFDVCLRKIADHKLEMKLVDVEYSYNGSKVVFYFTADGRVDFRELVKDLASVFKTRIELRQIGVRDEAKMLGGLGSCGRPVCCKSFLADFTPVSIKMAKEQNLSLSPTKISGICGRLMCCLKYEQDCYETMRKQMPRVSRDIMTPDGMGTVLENNVITERTRVRVTLADGTFDVREYPFRELKAKGGGKAEAEESCPNAPDDDAKADGADASDALPLDFSE
ncbi:MAG TPA: stage 0 sporulation family protein [Clostridia bacterium]|nr:stage 0 sporulation family protein [Clostridia bacterium]